MPTSSYPDGGYRTILELQTFTVANNLLIIIVSFLPCYHVILVTCYHPDLAQETSHSLEAEAQKRAAARYVESIASKVSALVVANIIQNVSSSHGSSCTGDGYTAIQEHYDKLLGALTNMGMLEVAAKAYAKGLITPEIRDSVFSGKCAELKANVLLSAVQENIKTDPSAFDTFIKILRSERAYEHLADMVTSNFKT